MYEKPEGLWAFGTWVNGGHWSTCEARMIMAYYRVRRFEDARLSMKRLLTFARAFRMDNPLVKCGSAVYQPREPINLTYDAFGPAAALVRGLFEYRYSAEGLTLFPRVPPNITELQQKFPIRFGHKRLLLATFGQGAITRVLVNGQPWPGHGSGSVVLPYAATPDTAEIRIFFGDSQPATISKVRPVETTRAFEMPSTSDADLLELTGRLRRAETIYHRLTNASLGTGYEAAHAQLVRECIRVIHERRVLLAKGQLAPLPEASQAAADKLYIQTAVRLSDGLESVLASYAKSDDPHRKTVFALTRE
jgi:hypothetical protein